MRIRIHEDARNQRKTTGTRCSAWVRRLAASLFVFAALGTALPAAAQTAIWTATITPGNLGGYYGCDNGIASNHCSTATLLSDDDFTHGSTDYSVTGLYVSGGSLRRSNSPPTSRAPPTPPSASSSAAAIPSPSPTATSIFGVRNWSGTGLT